MPSRKHHARHCDFRRGKVSDHTPGSVPNDVLSRWLQMNEFQALPDTVHVREVHLLIRHLAFVPNKLFGDDPVRS